MSEFVRLMATTIIWGTLAAIILFSGPVSGYTAPLALVLTIGAAISTVAVWSSAKVKQVGEAAQAGKAKRNNRITRLMDSLDEDELDDLQAWMEARHDRRLADQDLIERTY